MGRYLALARAVEAEMAAGGAEPLPGSAEVGRMSLADFKRAGLLVTVRSRFLGEDVFFASDKAAARGAPTGAAVCLPGELRVAAGLDGDALRGVYRLKRRFGGTLGTPGLRQLQAEYDRLLARVWRGFAYLEDASIPRTERDRHLPAFEELLGEIADLSVAIRSLLGREMTQEQYLNGFGTGTGPAGDAKTGSAQPGVAAARGDRTGVVGGGKVNTPAEA